MIKYKKNRGIKLKKVLCYVAIVILLIFIILPPSLRIFAKDDFEEKPKDVVTLLTCTKNVETVNMPYLNGNLVSIKYTFQLENNQTNENDFPNDNLDNITNDNINSELKNMLESISTTQITTENDLTTYALDMKNINNSNLVPSKFKDNSTNMKIYYNNLGYTCNIIE